MNKRDLVTLVARDSDYSRGEVQNIMSKTFEVILENLKNGKSVGIINFGSFRLKYHKARKGYNPKAKKRIDIPEKITVDFTPTTKFAIKKNTPRSRES